MLRIRTRDDLMALIATGVRAHLRYLGDGEARAIADTVLRTMRQAGLRIRQAPNQALADHPLPGQARPDHPRSGHPRSDRPGNDRRALPDPRNRGS